MRIQDSRRSYRTYATEFNLFGGTRRYHRDYSDAGVPVGTTGLIQILDLSDTGVPVGTIEQIRYGQNLIKCRSTRRYYRTDQIRTCQIQEYP